MLDALLRVPVQVEAATSVLTAGFDIAVRYDRSVYDALFVAMATRLGRVG